MDIVTILAILAGILQLLGYVAYVRIEQIDPEPVTWFMFAYGTGLLTILEFDANADLSLLVLPITCALLAIWISFRCWKKARIQNPSKWWPEDWWPEDTLDKGSFVADIFITLGYIGAWALATFALLSEGNREIAVLAFLLLSNISTIPSFIPILQSTYQNPEREHWLPWVIWSVAYTLLGVATFAKTGFWDTEWIILPHALLMYPLINAPLHALVGILALKQRKSVPAT